MKKVVTTLKIWIAIISSLLSVQLLSAQPKFIMQGFYWNTNPGDFTNINNGGIWWDTIAFVAPQLKNAGFDVVWMPPAQKGFAGIFDC